MMKDMRGIAVIAVFAVLSSFGGENGESLAGQDAPISVRASLVPVFGRCRTVSPGEGFSPNHFPMGRINPRVKHYARALLRDPQLDSDDDQSVRIGAIWTLGFVGNGNDIQLVDSFISTHFLKKVRGGKATAGAAFIGEFAGAMTKREVAGAEQFAKKYASINSWGPSDRNGTMSPALADAQCRQYLFNLHAYLPEEWVREFFKQIVPGTEGTPIVSEAWQKKLNNLKKSTFDSLVANRNADSPAFHKICNEQFTKYGDRRDELIERVDRDIGDEVENEQNGSTNGDANRGQIDSKYESDGLTVANEGASFGTICSIYSLGALFSICIIICLALIVKAPSQGVRLMSLLMLVLLSLLAVLVLASRPKHVEVEEPSDARPEPKEPKVKPKETLDAPEMETEPSKGDGDKSLGINRPPRNPKELGSAEKEAYFKEAQEQFDVISKAFSMGKAFDSTVGVMDNGKPMKLPVPEGVAKEYETSVGTMAAALYVIGLRPQERDEFKIYLKDDGTDAGDELQPDDVVVTFRILGTHQLTNQRKELKQLRGVKAGKLNLETIDKEGNFIVCMLKRDGKWYWNPFGW